MREASETAALVGREPGAVPGPGGLAARAASSGIAWPYAIGIPAVHALSLLAFVPWLFSWTGVILVIVGHHLFGMLGISVGYHRLLAHRGFRCSRGLERALALLGTCCLQDSPLRWVAVHRLHHQEADGRRDPHSPRAGMVWAHLGWLIVEQRAFGEAWFHERYAPDLARDPFHRRLQRGFGWFWVYVIHALLFSLAGLAAGWAATGVYGEGVRLGLSVLVWGVFVRTVLVWHLTWSVNSLAHRWGSRRYPTSDESRNNWPVALLTHGEGWHNNHHGEPRSAAHGVGWWELDLAHRTIRLLERAGLARDVVGRTGSPAPPAPGERLSGGPRGRP